MTSTPVMDTMEQLYLRAMKQNSKFIKFELSPTAYQEIVKEIAWIYKMTKFGPTYNGVPITLNHDVVHVRLICRGGKHVS